MPFLVLKLQHYRGGGSDGDASSLQEGRNVSLNRSERLRTSQELASNFRQAGLTSSKVQADLGFTEEQLNDTLTLSQFSDPVNIWILRDYLERAVISAGGTPAPYSVLTEQGRARADIWFGLRPVPEPR
ncbi:DUF2316 domain-containing protein [Arthrobacter sp. AQ5-06]|nr:DUF2316 domain-containing protein [Arthrobacter sp. AQ5-06]